jgi:hypothetical protein
MNIDVIITVLSWEERYLLALEQHLSNLNPSLVIVFRYSTNSEWKESNLTKTEELLKDRMILVDIDGSKPNLNWIVFQKVFGLHCTGKNILLDITTMPRESIWLSLYNCKKLECNTRYVYFKPAEYSQDWISRDPGKPRMLYKMSGIAKLGTPSLLVITAGYDIQRLDSLVHNFEPKETVVLLADGDEQRNKDNFEVCSRLLDMKYGIKKLIKYDPYDVENSFALIENRLVKGDAGNSYLDKFNIILNSLGAKTSAITLFKIWLKYPQVALSYIPSREYNRNYSSGIGRRIDGELNF